MKTKKNNKLKEQNKKSEKDIELRKLDLMEKIIDKVIPEVIKFFEQRLLKHESPIVKSTIWGFIAIIVLILAGSFFLVTRNKLDSSGFTFIVGIILGYFLSAAKMFIRREEV